MSRHVTPLQYNIQHDYLLFPHRSQDQPLKVNIVNDNAYDYSDYGGVPMMTTMMLMMIMTMCGVVTRLSKEQMTLAHFGLHDKRSHQHSKKEELIHWLKVRRCASAIGWYSQIERELLKEGVSGTWNQDHLGVCVCVICNSNISQLPTSNTPPNIFIGPESDHWLCLSLTP